ncbi:MULTISPECIES: ArnT family glycosyltransferase [Rhizobium]|uniref:ArnT family glycosyltransferase n=1 Tax=Rhizobium TaxID=379 RepID=UPI0028A7F742
MQNAASMHDAAALPHVQASEQRQWMTLALAAIVLVTLLRILGLAFNRTDLFVDEAQYWLWGREMAFGAYSKPPLIGWLIRAASILGGGEGTFQVRLAAPVVHGAAAVAILALGRMIYDSRLAALAAVIYLTLPAVTLGSLLISTDTPMMLFIALSMISVRKLALARAEGKAAVFWSVALGLCFGLGLMSKYAMIYFLPCFIAAGWLCVGWRIRLRDAAIALVVCAAVIAPNLWWNAAHDFMTARHTADNANWHGIQLKIGPALEFFFSQAGVVGPFVFVAMIIATFRAKTAEARALVALSVPIVLLITAQGLMSRALANWAVGAYAAGVLLAVPVLASRRWLTVSTLVLGGIVAIALPMMTIAGTELRLPSGELAMKRYLGRSELVSTGFARAQEAGADAIVASDRSILAELFYQLRDEKQVLLRALPETGVPSSHYALLYPLKTGEAKNPVYLAIADAPPSCLAGETPLSRWVAGPGFLEGREIGIWRLPPQCIPGVANGQ